MVTRKGNLLSVRFKETKASSYDCNGGEGEEYLDKISRNDASFIILFYLFDNHNLKNSSSITPFFKFIEVRFELTTIRKGNGTSKN